ncbi:MAG: hypothetical protein HKP58_06575 [Desulfatitalea sp.]|nr:hypothetical protein [Desulfatitalea sp.]NNK00062.1 hypothetical protein [Desulfatitalea sp.]
MDKTVKIVVVVFAALGLGLFGYYWINQWHGHAVEQATDVEKQACLERIARMEAEVQRLSRIAASQAQAVPDPREMNSAFGSDKPMMVIQADTTDCRKITAQTIAFFQYLDSKAYLIWPGINMRADEMFQDVFSRLAADPPTNVGEMDNLYTLTRNVTHLYRVLGKDRIDLVKGILNSEAAVVEPAMAVLFTWMTVCNAGEGPETAQVRLKTLYQYAAFFLNTLGGRSYLLRRDSKLRMLINYYALRLIDMANAAKFNSYGLDIRPHLDYLFYDINNQKGLLYRERYLTHLAAMKDKYE